MWRIERGWLKPLLALEGVAEPYCMPRQSLPEVWWQNGYVDIIRPHVILDMGLMCGHRVIPFVVDEPILELDYVESVPLVEEALARLARGEAVPAVPGDKRFPV